MLGKLTNVVLVSSSLAPVSILYGLSRASLHQGAWLGWFAGGLVLALLGVYVVRRAAVDGQEEPAMITKSKPVNKEALAFFITYSLPLLVNSDKAPNFLAIAVFIAFVAVILLQMELLHVNPLLGLFGYKFFEVSPSSNETALLITKNRSAEQRAMKIVRLSLYVWVEK